MADDDVRGRFLWFDLLTTSPDGAREFYTEVVGWDIQPLPGPIPYTMWATEHGPVGGTMELPDQAREQGAPPHWMVYIGSPDVDETVARAEELGAEVLVRPTDIPRVGRFSVLTDPQGAAFAVYTPGDKHPVVPADEPRIGEFSWRELATTDHEAAFDFYHELFGWTRRDALDMGEEGLYQMYGFEEGLPLGGMFDKPAEVPGPPAWLAYVRVPDVHDAVETVTALGGEVLNGPMEVPGGDWVVQCRDPQGAVFALHHRGEPT